MLRALCEGRVFPGKEHDDMLQEMALIEVKAIYSDWISLNTLDTRPNWPESAPAHGHIRREHQ